MSIGTLALLGGIAGISSVAVGIFFLSKPTRSMKAVGIYFILTGFLAAILAVIARQ